MSRPADWTLVEYDSDPVPGSPSGVLRASQRYLTIADSIADAKLTILGVFDNDELVGDSIDAVREVALEVADRIGRAKERYVGVGNALAGYVQPLEDAQRDSEDILNGAIAARDERIYAEERVYYWERELDEAVAAQDTARTTKAEDKIEEWRGEFYVASNAINAAVNNLQAVIEARNAAADRAADAIEKVENTGGLNDDFWNNVDQWFEENPWIDDVLMVIGVLVTILAVVAMFVPGLNLIVLAVGIALAAVTIAKALLQGLSGNKTWGQAAFEIVMALASVVGGGIITAVIKRIAAKMPLQAVTSLLISSSRTGAGITRPAAIQQVADFIASGPSARFVSDIGQIADIAQLAKMPLTSGKVSPVLAAMGLKADYLFGTSIALTVGPTIFEVGQWATGAELGGEKIDLQDHKW